MPATDFVGSAVQHGETRRAMPTRRIGGGKYHERTSLAAERPGGRTGHVRTRWLCACCRALQVNELGNRVASDVPAARRGLGGPPHRQGLLRPTRGA